MRASHLPTIYLSIYPSIHLSIFPSIHLSICLSVCRQVWDAVYSEDSAYLVTASSDQTARLWDVASGETIRHYTGHHKAVIAVALHDRNTGPGGGAA